MKYIYSANEFFDCIIDKDSLFKMLDLNKSRLQEPKFYQYIDNWKKALFNAYTAEINSKTILIGKEFFRESVFIDKNEMRFHFDIDKAIDLCHSKEKLVIPIEYISDKLIEPSIHKIKYTPTNEIDEKFDYSRCDIPVIMTTLTHGGFIYLIIDGNHRVEARKKHNINYINAVFLTLEETVSTLHSKFEMAAYEFLYEGFLLAQEDFSILDCSYSRFYL